MLEVLGATSTILPQPPPSSTHLRQLYGRAGPVDHPLLLERRLGRGETGDRHAERRAGHVVHAHAVTEFHRRGLATMLPADADLELGPRSPAELEDRKSTRLNSSHGYISYAVFCLKKKKNTRAALDAQQLPPRN